MNPINVLGSNILNVFFDENVVDIYMVSIYYTCTYYRSSRVPLGAGGSRLAVNSEILHSK